MSKNAAFSLSAESLLIFYEEEEDDSYEVVKPRPDLAPGTSYWQRDGAGKIRSLQFICPCGCGKVATGISVNTGQKIPSSWLWDGNEEKPTISPSIFCTGWPCRWHGFLKAGIFESC